MFQKLKFFIYDKKVIKEAKKLARAELEFGNAIRNYDNTPNIICKYYMCQKAIADMLDVSTNTIPQIENSYYPAVIGYQYALFDTGLKIHTEFKKFLNAVIIRNDCDKFKRYAKGIPTNDLLVISNVISNSNSIIQKVSSQIEKLKSDLENENETADSLEIGFFLNSLMDNKFKIDAICRWASEDPEIDPEELIDGYIQITDYNIDIFELSAKYYGILIDAITSLLDNKSNNSTISN